MAPGPAKEIFTSAIQNLQKSQGAAGILFIVGLAGALWSASGYVVAFMRASNAIYDVEEGRPIWKTAPVRLGVTLVLVLMLAIVAVGVVFTGGLAKQAGGVLGVSESAVTVWNIAKWPVLLLIVSLMFAILYYASPNVKHPKFQWVSPGGIVAVITWIIASAAFAFYVANFASYNKTYGALGGVIIFLVWLWISNIAVLLGAEFNAELERGRQIEAPEARSDTELRACQAAERARGQTSEKLRPCVANGVGRPLEVGALLFGCRVGGQCLQHSRELEPADDRHLDVVLRHAYSRSPAASRASSCRM